MYFYEVLVGARNYHADLPLTYSSEDKIATNSLVEVGLRGKTVLGMVIGSVQKPKFKTLAVKRSFTYQLGDKPMKLMQWMRVYYPALPSQILQLFLPVGPIPKKLTTNSEGSALTKFSTAKLPPLTKEQRQVVRKLTSYTGTALLHGDTGTGKTRVYIELSVRAIQSGKSAMILTPEIGLTPQLESIFKEVFGNQVITFHSALSPAKKREIWFRLSQSKTPLVLIGPRSALFLPLKNLGLIVVDEAHDNSYKQDQSPYYLATRVASKLAALNDCLCLLGTATPNVADYFSFDKHGVPILRMQRPARQAALASQLTIIDKTNKRLFGKSSLFADETIQSIQETHDRGLVSMIFLNRRGTARLVICNSCGWQAECPKCDSSLIYHKDTNSLKCHVCGYQQDAVLSCPVCKSSGVAYLSVGTKALVDEISRLFPTYKTMRFDSDNKQSESLHRNFENIKKGHTDVIIGTQIISKGHDLTKLGLVVIPVADSEFFLPDFTSSERAYQLLSQVIGRVGRTSQSTRVIIQTKNPKSNLIKYIANSDWSKFYNEELENRQKFNYPPFRYLLQLTYSHKTTSKGETTAKSLADKLNKLHGVEIMGPALRLHARAMGKYHWQIIVKSKNRQNLVNITKSAPKDWKYNLDPTTLT